MWTDPIVEELHHLREAHAARFHHDLRAMVGDLQTLERDWPAPKIDPPPKPPARPPWAGTPAVTP
jgi:predicted component of type VI protein secretion system